jgi:hypothetical protein
MSALYAQSGPPSVPRIRGSSRSRMLLPAAWARCVWSGRTDTSSGWGPARPRARLPRILRCLHAGLPRRADSYRRGKAAPDRYCGGPNARHADDPAAPRYAARRGSSTVHLRGQDHPPKDTRSWPIVMRACPNAYLYLPACRGRRLIQSGPWEPDEQARRFANEDHL